MSWYPPPKHEDDFDFDKNVDINVEANVELNFDVNVNVDKDVDVDVNFDVRSNVEGNTAIFNIDVEALGDDSYAELNLVVLTTDEMSMITATGEAHTA